MGRLTELFLDHVGQTSDSPIGIEVERADGVYIYSPSGKKYLDLVSGVSVSNVGHNNPKVIEAICNQAKDYLHIMVYGEVLQSPQIKYAVKLSEVMPKGLNSVYFVNSGSEAIEAALKLAKRYTGRTQMISFKKAYHGSTHGALSMMGDEFFRNSFRPLLPDTYQLEYNDFNALSFISEKTACVLIEPVQGEAGFIAPKGGYLQALRDRCDEVGALLIFDEIQSGFGRTGKMFASQYYDVTPDIMVLAKSMGGGMPLGGVVSSKAVMSSFKSNPVLGHITTFGGHPVCCAAGLAALEYILDNSLIDSVEEKSLLFESLLKKSDKIKEIRRVGLMIALEFNDVEFCGRVCKACVREGILTEGFLFRESAIRIAPPLTISETEIREAAEIINRILNTIG